MAKNTRHIFLLASLLLGFVLGSECLLRKGNKSSHTKDIAKKQQVLVPLRNMAGTGFGRNNPFISQTFHLEGTNEVDPLKDPTTIFLNGDNRADAYQGPLMSETQTDLRGDNEAQFQQSSLEDNNFSIDSSLFGTRNENYRDGGNGNENSDNGDAAYEDENQLTLPNDEQTSDRYFNPTPEEEDSEPSQTMVDYNNYDSHLISNAAVQGLPTLSSIVGSRLRALGTLNSLDLKHPSVRMPYYTSLVRPMLNDKATGVTHSLHFDAETTSEAAKKDNSTNVHSKHKKDASNKEEEAKRQEQEYKSNVQNAEMAANLAEAAKTLTKLVKKLTEHDAIIRKHEKELAAKKNQSEVGIDGEWSEWSRWSKCSAICGGGLSYTKRNCDAPSPSHGGHSCSGRRIRVRMCNLNRCGPAHRNKVNLQRSLSEMAATRSSIYGTQHSRD